jgi:hypothetical protein
MKIRHVWGKVYGSSLEENYTRSCGKHNCKIVWFLEIIIQLFGKKQRWNMGPCMLADCMQGI